MLGKTKAPSSKKRQKTFFYLKYWQIWKKNLEPSLSALLDFLGSDHAPWIYRSGINLICNNYHWKLLTHCKTEKNYQYSDHFCFPKWCHLLVCCTAFSWRQLLFKRILDYNAGSFVDHLAHCYFTRLNLKKMRLCLPALLKLHRNHKQKEFLKSCEGLLR